MNFLAALDRVRRWQRLGRVLAAALLALAGLAGLALLLGLADAAAGFETGARAALVATAIILSGAFLLAALTFAVRFSRRRGAALADHLSGSSRGPASAGLALAGREPETPLAGYLAERSLDDATRRLAALPASRLIPWRAAGVAAAALALALLPIGILALLRPEATATVAHRLLHPRADLPPWSPLDFALDPSEPVAVYGHDLPLVADITGGALEHPVECLVRRPGSGEIERLPAFRESDTRYSRTLESLTENVSVAFACGRARSAWHPVELLLQPKVVAGEVTVTPPDHTDQPATTNPLDSGEIRAVQGGRLRLDLTSNRPLAGSDLVFTPQRAPGEEPEPERVPGTVVDTRTIRFELPVTRPGDLAATLVDVRGTPAAAPLEIKLRAVPDEAPEVELRSPPPLLLATPSTRVPVEGAAEDDHALSRVQFVRTLRGFRDRARVVARSLNRERFEFDDALDLAELGVRPGQTLELFLEASDHNPSLLGQGTSGISRVHIISEDDYAYRIRAKTTLEEFSERYRTVHEHLEAARQALEEMDRAADLDDPEAAEKARDKAAGAHEQAAETLARIAEDFPAFEIEKRLKQLADERTSDLRENLEALAEFDPDASESAQRGAIREMRDRLGRRPDMDRLQRDAGLVAEAGELLEMAAKFQQIYQNQKSVAERIETVAKEIGMGNDANRGRLPALARTQRKNREALAEFAAELRKRAEAVERPELAPMRGSALEFLEALALADPGSVMDLTAESADLGEANDAYVSAEMARSQLASLMQSPSPFPQACQGNSPSFSIPRPDVNETMRQLLEGLMCQNPGSSPNSGQGGGGMGMGGTGPTGNAQPGYAMLDTPVLGPQRMRFEPPSLGASAGGEGDASPRGAAPDEAAETESLAPTETPRAGEASPDLEAVPESYRQAVKTYFTPED